VTNPTAADWYKYVVPWSLQLHNIIAQRGSVTILNNVIDPSKGDKVYLDYSVTTAGSVTIDVFNLAGDLVNVLYRGTRAAGNYATAWNGRDLAGYIAARGIYFIRVVAPGIDEFRKVLVVK
jgi:flagellar hook assembly protein FlgD